MTLRQSHTAAVGRLGALAAAFLAAGCSGSRPITVSSQYGPGIKFTGLGPTYAWAPDSPEQTLGTAESRAFLRGAVERHLGAKGFTQGSAGAVDFWMEYRLARRQKTDTSVSAFGEVVEEGALMLQALDPATREFIWRGIAQAQIQDSDSPEVREQRLESAVARLMESFPAKASTSRPE